MWNKIKYFIFLSSLTFIVFLSCSGCMKMALRMSPGLFENMSLSIFEECDPDLAGKAIPTNLKLLEGILKSDPDNSEILGLLCTGFCGYAMLFVENDDKERASNLYYRAAVYGLKAVGLKGEPDSIGRENLENLFKRLDEKKERSLMWASVSWSSWINLNLHKPAAVAQLGMVQLCIDELTEKNPDLFHGLPYLLKAVSLSARPPMLGGDYQKAKEYYEKALSTGNREFFLSQYFYARYYCVGVQNKEMFVSLLNEIIEKKREFREDTCLINTEIRAKAKVLLENIDDYFI